MADMSFSLNCEVFVVVSAQFKSQILLQEIFEVTSIGIYHALTIEKSQKRKPYISPYNEEEEGLLKCLKEI